MPNRCTSRADALLKPPVSGSMIGVSEWWTMKLWTCVTDTISGFPIPYRPPTEVPVVLSRVIRPSSRSSIVEPFRTQKHSSKIKGVRWLRFAQIRSIL